MLGGRQLLGVTAAALILATFGCSDSEMSGTIGALGEGTFRYSCVDEGDAVCNETDAVDTNAVSVELGINSEMPTAVAVGARFDLSYQGDVTTDDGELLIVQTVPARDELVTNQGGFIIEQPGVYAFLARSPKGIVADFIDVTAAAPTDLEIWKDEQRVTSFEMTVGSETNVGVLANDTGGIALAGALPYTWSSSDTAVVAVDDIGTAGTPTSGIEINDDEIRAYAVGLGSATLSISRGDLTHSIEVTVVEEVPR